MIYFDQAATSFPKPKAVAEAVLDAVQSLGSSGRGAHGLALKSNRLVYDARESLAEFFNAEDASCFAFSSGATESLNTALFGLLAPGSHVLTTALEHNSVLRPLYLLQAKGLELSILPADGKGCLNIGDFKKFLRPDTKALICTGASNVTGNLLDLAYLGDFCRRHEILFILDAAQVAGLVPLDVQKLKIDVLCFSGHKSLYGPAGIGGMYVRKGLTIRPLKVGGSGSATFSRKQPEIMPEALEAGTLNTPGIAGLLAGLNYIEKMGGPAEIWQRETKLAARFLNGVKKLAGVEIYGDFAAKQRCPIVALNIKGLDSSYASQLLADNYGIYVRGGGHCAPLMHEALGTKSRGVVRFSFSHLNTPWEIDRGLAALGEIGEKYGR
ncbi:MAG TPA: aminotransferase class V-fold PLP-dependent enzyme [Firmicutes bacterium]|nr:aminotransferase class V-fold PLP-dependent enzyme [Bacillota bacterium]